MQLFGKHRGCVPNLPRAGTQPQISQGKSLKPLLKNVGIFMRTHIKTFHIRFTEIEYERLCKYSKRAGLRKSTYIRHMINGLSPKENPPADYFRMMKSASQEKVRHRLLNNYRLKKYLSLPHTGNQSGYGQARAFRKTLLVGIRKQ